MRRSQPAVRRTCSSPPIPRAQGAVYRVTNPGFVTLVGLAADDHLGGFTNRRVPVPCRGTDRRLRGRVVEDRQRDDGPPPDLRRGFGDQVQQNGDRRLVADRSESGLSLIHISEPTRPY